MREKMACDKSSRDKIKSRSHKNYRAWLKRQVHKAFRRKAKHFDFEDGSFNPLRLSSRDIY